MFFFLQCQVNMHLSSCVKRHISHKSKLSMIDFSFVLYFPLLTECVLPPFFIQFWVKNNIKVATIYQVFSLDLHNVIKEFSLS